MNFHGFEASPYLTSPELRIPSRLSVDGYNDQGCSLTAFLELTKFTESHISAHTDSPAENVILLI